MVLFELLGALNGLVKVKIGPDIDSAVFKLHYKVTATILFTFCLLITANSMIGDPINCTQDSEKKLPAKVVNTFCWIHTTYTLPKHLNQRYGKGTHLVYPGIGPHRKEDDKIYHSYYQWVPFALLFQGIMFYIPHWIWKTWEGKQIETMVQGLSLPVMNKAERREQIQNLAEYIHASLHRHNCYAVKFFFCEFLNLCNTVLNIWALNRFFGGMFMSLGIDVVRFTEMNQDERTDPLIVLFPRVTKCDFHMYGPSGGVQQYDFMCVLALNIFNEKIYVFLWFWIVILCCISSLHLIYRIVLFSVPSIRSGLLQKRANMRYKSSLKSMTNKLQVGDFFLLFLISKNLELLSFSILMEELAIRVNSTAPHPDLELSSQPPKKPENFRLIAEHA